jgi:hypothetical protein
LGGGVLVIVLALVPVILHYRARAAAEKFKAELRAQGERLSIGELVPLPPLDVPNGAGALLDAMARLTSFGYEIQPGVMKMLEPGHARVAWQQATLPADKSADIWPALRTHLETNEVALADLRAALRKPVLHFQVNYHQGFENFSMPHLAQAKAASQRLSAAVVMALRDQRGDDAFANLEALINLPARHREEPFLISQLVRCAMIAIAASATWEALHSPHWSDEQLIKLQSAWEAVQTIPQMERAFAMERACVLVEYAKTRESMKRLDLMTVPGGASNPLEALADAGNELMQDPAAGFESLMDRFPRRWVWKWWNCYEDEIWFLQSVQRVLDTSRGTTNGQPYIPLQTKLETDVQLAGEPPRQFLLSRMLAPETYSKSMDKAMIAETQRRIATTAIALKRFERRFNKRPTELSALVPAFLPAVPLDPMDGQPLRYRLSGTNAFLLYSIGLDGADDGGDANSRVSGSRNFFWTQCKDFVWPQPATPEQLREFNTQLEQKRGARRPRPAR